MQDKITIADAPDCLNTNDKAMWVLGYQTAIEARSQCLHHIQEPATKTEALAHYSRQAILAMGAPAAVAVPDERVAFEQWANKHYSSITPEMIEAAEEAYMPFGDMGLAIQCALAAAPQPTEAAPVQLPEPSAWMLGCQTMGGDVGWNLSWYKSGAGVCHRLSGKEFEHPLYTEQQVRQLLAANGIKGQST